MRPDRIMKNDLLQMVEMFKEQGIDFKETPPLFRWGYEEYPELLFELLITQPEVEEVEQNVVEQNAPTTEIVQ